MSVAKRSRTLKVNREKRRRELIAALRELAAVEGPDVTLRQFAESLGRSTQHVELYFGSWGDLREAAGLPRKRSAGYARETLLDALRKAERASDRPVSRRRFAHLTGISPSPGERLFGSWQAFREAAGFTAWVPPGTPSRYSRDQLLRLMHEQIPVLGPDMTRNQFAEAVGVSTATIDRLGNWSALRKELGLVSRRSAKAKAFLEALGIELVEI
jgi:hypothetical protein